MKRFDDLLSDAFDEIAERAVPSASALADFRARAQRHDQHQEVVVRLTPDDTPIRRPRWTVPVAIGVAAAGVLAVGGVILVRSGTDDVVTVDDGGATPTVEVEPDDATTGATSIEPDDATSDATTVEPTTAPATGGDDAVSGAQPDLVMTDWAPVLAGVEASATPEPAVCPAGSVGLGNAVGAPAFLELSAGPIEAVAAFDPSSHSIVVVRRGAYSVGDVNQRETVAGRLDLCSGTWSPMSADFGMLPADPALPEEWPEAPDWPDAIVYDVDSGALVAFMESGVRVYDPDTDEWQLRVDAVPLHDEDDAASAAPWVDAAFYHPASGLIVTHGGFVATYDVDGAEWQWVSYVSTEEFEGEFLGLNTELDRFVFASVGDPDHITRLVEPTTGAATDIPTPGRPEVGVGDAFGSWEAYGQADGTVFVADHLAGTICGFGAETLTWDACVDEQADDGSWAIVGDPINDRLVIIPPSGTIRTAPLP